MSAALLGLWVIVVLTTRYTSLASITAAVAAAPLAWAFGYPWYYVVFTGLAALLVLARHRANFGRLSRGQEARIDLWRPRRA
jgi:glycerol-3-phosphate acyltransferase PlsY